MLCTPVDGTHIRLVTLHLRQVVKHAGGQARIEPVIFKGFVEMRASPLVFTQQGFARSAVYYVLFQDQRI